MADGFFGKIPALPPGFQQAASPAAGEIEAAKVVVSLSLDADILDYFLSAAEPSDWAEHMNGVLRFYMETNRMREADIDSAMHTAHEPDLTPIP